VNSGGFADGSSTACPTIKTIVTVPNSLESKPHTKPVAIKAFCVYQADDFDLVKKARLSLVSLILHQWSCKEAVTWKRFRHLHGYFNYA
jgi:hypothetical protein